jgi:hypothetical protein
MKTILILISVFSAVGCSLTVAPDGSKAGTLDGMQFLRAIEILSTK